jgi:hypothetical protein
MRDAGGANTAGVRVATSGFITRVETMVAITFGASARRQ